MAEPAKPRSKKRASPVAKFENASIELPRQASWTPGDGDGEWKECSLG